MSDLISGITIVAMMVLIYFVGELKGELKASKKYKLPYIEGNAAEDIVAPIVNAILRVRDVENTASLARQELDAALQVGQDWRGGKYQKHQPMKKREEVSIDA